MTNEELCDWLRQNSSGACAAERSEQGVAADGLHPERTPRGLMSRVLASVQAGDG